MSERTHSNKSGQNEHPTAKDTHDARTGKAVHETSAAHLNEGRSDASHDDSDREHHRVGAIHSGAEETGGLQSPGGSSDSQEHERLSRH